MKVFVPFVMKYWRADSLLSFYAEIQAESVEHAVTLFVMDNQEAIVDNLIGLSAVFELVPNALGD